MKAEIFRFTALRWLAYAIVAPLMVLSAVLTAISTLVGELCLNMAEFAISVRETEAEWAAVSQVAKEIAEGGAMAQYQGTVFQANVDRALRVPAKG